jgi:hypothetical protein
MAIGHIILLHFHYQVYFCLQIIKTQMIMLKKSSLLFVLLLLQIASFAQRTKHTISGNIKDAKTGESIIGAVVKVQELDNINTTSNEYGFYSFTFADTTYTFTISKPGYITFTKQINLQQNEKLEVSLQAITKNQIAGVKVTSQRKDKNVTQAQMGVEKLNMAQINKVPVLFGEKDVLKTIQLIPGIKSAGEGNAGFYVRGGGADQNLILLDEAPVYNASHLLGFFSTFNSDAIKDVSVFKGGMPSNYGGRLSSVLDIKMNEGNSKKFHVGGGIGAISSKLYVEGPIVKDKGSFLITGRRTYADLFLKLTEDFKDNKLFFYDLNLKANYKINDNNRVYLSGYFGRDILGVGTQFGLDWGNSTGTVRWNHTVNSKLFSNTSLIFSNYSYGIDFNFDNTDVNVTSRIRDYNVKQEWQYFPNPKNKIKFGVNSIYHTIVPGQISTTGNFTVPKLQERYALENAIYATNEWAATSKINVIYGLRGTGFTTLGKGDFYTYNDAGEAIGSTNYGKNEIVKNYFNLEPRLSASYIINPENSIKASYARNTQNLHLISNSTSTTPTDLWIPSSKNIKPEISDQVSLGYYKNFNNNNYEFSVETYYKNMQNQIDYRNGANTQANDKIEGELLTGTGRAYGAEFYLKKNTGRFNGWVGYTLSKTERQIAGINDGKWYNAKQDKTHDVSIVGIYELTPKWSISGTWIYNTGNAVTFPSGKYTIDNTVNFLYSERNGYRMPANHRLDLGATHTKVFASGRERVWSFSLYNAYGRENAYIINFKEDPKDATKTIAEQTSLFRWVPSISYNFKF